MGLIRSLRHGAYTNCVTPVHGLCLFSPAFPLEWRLPNDRYRTDRPRPARAAETHHVVWRITDGDDPDWASWYADWLLDLSELPALLGTKPVRSHLIHALVQLDRDHSSTGSQEQWEDSYARGLIAQFAA